MRILGIERDRTACNYYRILLPLSKLDEKGMAEVVLLNDQEFGTDKAKDMLLWADIIVFQRPATEAWFNFIKMARKLGKIVVSDYDDDPFHTSPLSPAYAHLGTEEVVYEWPDGTKEKLWSEDMVSPSGNKIFDIERNIQHRDMFRLNFKKSDMVTCTTDELKQEFLKINPNVSVLPNCLDFEFYPSGHEFVKKEIRIGWQGGASHYEDLCLMAPAIIEVLRKYSNIKFVYFGDMRFAGLFKAAPQSQIEWHSWVHHNAYPFKLALMNLDIGLCPLVDNPFNRNKSAIKWMEYAAVGVPAIVSGISPYAPVVKHKETAYVAASETKEAWIDALEEMIGSIHLRRSMASNAFDDCKANHNIETKVHLWSEAYTRLMKGEEVMA